MREGQGKQTCTRLLQKNAITRFLGSLTKTVDPRDGGPYAKLFHERKTHLKRGKVGEEPVEMSKPVE